MAITFRNSNENGGGGSAGTVAVTVTSISAGDIIIVAAANDTSQDITQISDGTSNLTLRTQLSSSGARLRVGYLLSSVASGSVTYTATFGASASAREIHAWAFNPGGGTAAFDTSREDAVQVSTTDVNSGNITTTGTDEVVVSFTYQETGGTHTSESINGVAADGTPLDPGGNMSSWYRIVTGTFTGESSSTLSNTSRHITSIIGINTGSGGDVSTGLAGSASTGSAGTSVPNFQIPL